MKTNRILLGVLLTISGWLCAPNPLNAQGTAFTYQGRLNDGAKPANGNYDLTFALFANSSGAPQVGGTVTNIATTVTNGLFTITLDFGANFSGESRWLEIGARTNSGGTFSTLLPRQALTPTPYAIAAAALVGAAVGSNQLATGSVTMDKLATGAVSTLQLADGAVTSAKILDGAITTNDLSAGVFGAFWQLGGNAGTVPGTQFIGTTDNQPLDFKVNGLRALRLELNTNGAPNLIGGSPVNFVGVGLSGATIAGGGATNYYGQAASNSVYADFGFIGGGSGNTVTANHAAIVGGNLNTASGGDSTAMGFSTTASGFSSTAMGSHTTAGGNTSTAMGFNTFAIGIYSTAMGLATSATGYCSTATGIATTAGGLASTAMGYGSIASADYSTALGIFSTASGNHSTAMGFIATASGDSSAAIGSDSTASGDCSTVMGFLTTASGFSSTAMGNGTASIGDYSTAMGLATSATGYCSTAMGNGTTAGGDSSTAFGFNTTASGSFSTAMGSGSNATNNYAFAAGRRAQADHLGALVWADSTDADIASTRSNSVTMRAAGGYRLFSNSSATIGVVLTADGNSWAVFSDRNAKRNIQPVNVREVLEKLSHVPVQKWNYKEEPDDAVPHLGPMAQDFKTAFYPGRDDKTISTLEFDGVALAAIQGLNQKLTDELKQKETEITELKARLEKLEQLFFRRVTMEN